MPLVLQRGSQRGNAMCKVKFAGIGAAGNCCASTVKRETKTARACLVSVLRLGHVATPRGTDPE